jgi:hypothetical protein
MTLRKAWFIPVVISNVCYSFGDVSVNCGNCKKPWAEFPPGEEKRPYALLLVEIMAAKVMPRDTIAPLAPQKVALQPNKLNRVDYANRVGQGSFMSRVFNKRSPMRSSEKPGTALNPSDAHNLRLC